MTDPGIYFHMSEEEYLADPALSSSGVRDLLISPLTFWVNSHMCDWAEQESVAKNNGAAFHKRIVEGAEAFKAAYAAKPDKADYPDALDGSAQLKAWLRENELPVTGTIPELCDRIREADPSVELWPDIMADFEDSTEGKIRITRDLYQQIEFRAGIVDRHPAVQKAFKGGFPEVSIFWIDEETGIAMKARIDYLKTRAIVELKTFSNQFDKPLFTTVCNAIAQRRYHVQAAIYLEAVEQAKKGIRGGNGFVCDDAPYEWLKEFAQQDHAYVFVFIETGQVPNVVPIEYRTHRGKDEVNFYWTAGLQHYRRALEIYRQCVETFGDDPWMEPLPLQPLIDEALPVWME